MQSNGDMSDEPPKDEQGPQGDFDWAQDLGISPNFLPPKKDSDWVFVIKLHAIIETAMNRLLQAFFNAYRRDVDQKGILKFITSLETSGESVSKLALLSALNLLPPEMKKYVRTLSEVRNRLVHDPRNYDFTFASHVEGLDTNQRANWESAMLTLLHDPLVADGMEPRQTLRKEPRYVAFANAMLIVLSLKNFRRAIAQRDEALDKAKKLLDKYDSMTEENPD